jgi:hypothetical protein
MYSVLLIGWHYPSDVLGGVLVAGAWAGLVIAALREAEHRWPPAAARVMTAPGAITGLSGAVAAVLLSATAAGASALRRPMQAFDYAEDHTTLMAGASFIALAALALVAWTAAHTDR